MTQLDTQIAFLDALLADPERRLPRLDATCETRTVESVLGRPVKSIEDAFAPTPRATR